MNSPGAGYLATGVDKERVKRDGWQQQDILVVSLNDPRLNPMERELVKQIGEKIYGHRICNGHR